MSLTDTSELIKESRRIVDASGDNTVLNMILEIVTNIDNRVKQMESKIDKRLEELKQAYLSVSAKVRTLENNMTEFSKKMTECETSCQGLSNLFDKTDKQIKLNTRNLIHQDQRINTLEKRPIVQPVVQPVTESNEIKRLREDILDLKCRSMKNNLIFTGLHRVPNENTEDLLRCFLYNELGVDYKIEFGNVHRFKTRGGDNRRAPIVARFLYHVDLEHVLRIANRLKGTQYGIREQFPQEIENRRKPLYPIMRRARQERRQVTLARDRLYIDNELYVPNEIDEDVTPQVNEEIRDTPKGVDLAETPPPKRQRQGPSPPKYNNGRQHITYDR